jgi:hypothetical protein
MEGKDMDANLYRRDQLKAGNKIEGPAVGTGDGFNHSDPLGPYRQCRQVRQHIDRTVSLSEGTKHASNYC